MSYFTLKFDTDNAAFEDTGLAHESARILRDVADRIENGAAIGTVRDVNGNTIGRFEFIGGE